MPRRQFLSAGSVSQESHPWQSPVVLLAEAAAAAGLRAAHTRVVWTMSVLLLLLFFFLSFSFGILLFFLFLLLVI